MTKNEAAYRDAALVVGFILLGLAVDQIAQHTDKH